MKCLCGCGLDTKYKWVHGHWNKTDSARAKLSQSHRGQISWRKGLTKETSEKIKIEAELKIGKKASDEARKNMSESHIGKRRSHESRVKQSASTSGNKNHFFGKHHTPETIVKLKEIGKDLNRGVKNNFYGKQHTEKAKQINREKHTRDKSWSWIDGRSFLPYCPKFNKGLKESIRKRDNHVCQLCGVEENGHKLHVHHIHYDKQNCNPDLISLCHRCHSKVNVNREFYESLFMNNLNDRQMLFWCRS